jgi:hypothetical protein
MPRLARHPRRRLLWLMLALGPRLAAASAPCDAATPAAAAEASMAALEGDFRRGARVARMDIHTSYERQRTASGLELHANQKTLWGVFDGDAEQTRLLYVFSGPGRLAGTTLLMHDRVAVDQPDEMWLYLRSFEIFEKLAPTKQRVLVPGTALTYEDARGFIPLDKYRFSFADAASSGALEILGCPRSDAIREHLGYRSLRLRVDPDKRIVRGVRYTGVGGRPLKTYTLLREVQVGDRFFPAAVRLEHLADGFVSEIGYEYWLPEAPPPAAFFEPSVEQHRFVDRLKHYVTQIGQGARIRQELEQADLRVREFEERLRRIQEAERSGRRFKQ